jgi:hypothetical protein
MILAGVTEIDIERATDFGALAIRVKFATSLNRYRAARHLPTAPQAIAGRLSPPWDPPAVRIDSVARNPYIIAG